MTLPEKIATLARYDEHVDLWRTFIRPLCSNHDSKESVSFWTFVKRSWRLVDRCPKCRGYYTSRGMPKAPPNLFDIMLSVHYGPELIRQLNEPIKLNTPVTFRLEGIEIHEPCKTYHKGNPVVVGSRRTDSPGVL